LLFAKSVSSAISAVAIVSSLSLAIPAYAEGSVGSPEKKQSVEIASNFAASSQSALIASTVCATCGATELNAVSLMEATGGKHKSVSLLTDSLWGNLILEMAYQRDPELQKIAKKLNLVNIGTMTSIAGIAGGTLAQGITALYVLNPPDGKPDSYAPLNVGVVLSSATLLTFAARVYFNHRLEKRIMARQLELKTRVESLLHHLEQCNGKCADAKNQLTDLIGERACREWVQLWQSSHQLAMNGPQRISLLQSLGR
jgi:hypothetical protein